MCVDGCVKNVGQEKFDKILRQGIDKIENNLYNLCSLSILTIRCEFSQCPFSLCSVTGEQV
jgi:hypothetical protein